MILGIGTDLVDSRRIQAAMNRYPDKFVKRLFTDAEINAAEKTGNPAGYLAKRFAVKEAVYKALNGSGIRPLGWRDAETINAADGAPLVKLYGRCKTALETMTPDGYKASLFVSISDEPPYALAFVVVDAVPIEWKMPHG
jgi:holo-[acyl-carrier protein] synthase